MVKLLKATLIAGATVLTALILAPIASAHDTPTSIHSSGGPGGPQHRMPHDIALNSTTNLTMRNGQNMATNWIVNWANTSMTRLVCVEAFHTTSGAKHHLGCAHMNFDVNGTNMYNQEMNVPLNMLPAGTYRLVYTYQDSAGFWHQITNTADRLVTITLTK